MISRAFTYDAENRQVGASTATTSGSYLYDGNSMRVQKIVGSATTTYVYDAFGNLAAEYSSAAAASPCGTATCYLTVDHLGSTRLLTDGTGATNVKRYDYLPFGEELLGVNGRSPTQGYSSAPDVLFEKFTGQDRDTETGIDFFNARYFSGAQGRFQSVDPANAGAVLGAPQTWNAYAYVGNNPMTYTDPSGMVGEGEALSPLCGPLAPVCAAGGVVADLLVLFGIFGHGGGHASTPPPEINTGPAPSTTMPLDLGLIFFAEGRASSNVTKHYQLKTACRASAAQVMQTVESNFPRFGNYSWGPFSVLFNPPTNLGVGSTIPISVRYFGLTQKMGVQVVGESSQSMTFKTLSGDHLLYPANITFASTQTSANGVSFDINLSGTFNGATNRAKYYLGGALLEDSQWHHFLDQVGGYCSGGK